jgi:hypothetical protein
MGEVRLHSLTQRRIAGHRGKNKRGQTQGSSFAE